MSIGDLFILVLIEVLIFWFNNQKIFLKKIISIIFLVNAVKIGLLSLIYLTEFAQSFYYNVAYMSAWLLIGGYFISALLFEGNFLFTRTEATALAFQTSVLSSIVWFFYATQSGPFFNPLYLIDHLYLIEVLSQFLLILIGILSLIIFLGNRYYKKYSSMPYEKSPIDNCKEDHLILRLLRS
jgi:hypothetical protein